MIRGLLGFVVGLICGFITISLIQMANTHFFPLPNTLPPNPDFGNPKHVAIMREFIEGLPLVALLVVIFSHGFGTFVGALAASYFVRPRHAIPVLVIGFLFLAGGVANLLWIPHPEWFAFADLAVYLPAAYLAGCCFSKTGGDAPLEPAEPASDSLSETADAAQA